jgi:hypothetical protein
MLLPPLLRAHGYMRTESPPVIWEAETEDLDFAPLLGEMIEAALRPGTRLSSLTLAAANVVVPPETQEIGVLSDPPVGEYVAVTVSGPGEWSADWRWTPRTDATSGKSPLSTPRLLAAGVRFAYGRALGTGSSMTVFLVRH